MSLKRGKDAFTMNLDNNNHQLGNDAMKIEKGKTYRWTANKFCSIDFKVIKLEKSGDVIGQELTTCDSTLPHVYRFEKDQLNTSNTTTIN